MRADVHVLGVQLPIGDVVHQPGAEPAVVRLGDLVVDLAPPDAVGRRRLVDQELVLRRAAGEATRVHDELPVRPEHRLAAGEGRLGIPGRAPRSVRVPRHQRVQPRIQPLDSKVSSARSVCRRQARGYRDRESVKTDHSAFESTGSRGRVRRISLPHLVLGPSSLTAADRVSALKGTR